MKALLCRGPRVMAVPITIRSRTIGAATPAGQGRLPALRGRAAEIGSEGATTAPHPDSARGDPAGQGATRMSPDDARPAWCAVRIPSAPRRPAAVP